MVSHAYPGDRPDVTQFAGVIDTLVARYQGLRAAVESLTVVYDAGQNSTGNHAVVEAAGIGFVGSLPPSDHADLLALPRSRYGVVEEARYPGLRCLDTTVTAFGRHPPGGDDPFTDPARGPGTGVGQTLAKARARLGDLAACLARGKTHRPRAAVEAEITAITKPRWVGRDAASGPMPRAQGVSPWRAEPTGTAAEYGNRGDLQRPASPQLRDRSGDRHRLGSREFGSNWPATRG